MPGKTFTLVSTEQIITTVQLMRNSRIHALLEDDGHFLDFIDKHCDVLAISAIRKEFLKRDLKELSRTKLDLAHYGSLLISSRESGSVENQALDILFITEFQLVFDKYKF